MPSQPRLVTLIVNPASGRALLLERQLPAIEKLLVQHGLSLQVLSTSPAPGSAEQLARSVLARSGQGSSVRSQNAMVVACGGDGTVHEVLQGLAQSETPLGILPLGTANALARHLGLPLDPLRAMERLLTATPMRVPIGLVQTSLQARYFLVMAGCGPDGALVHTLSTEAAQCGKRRFGRVSYYAHAARLFLTRRWPSFRVEYCVAGVWRETMACAVLASRLPNLGGLFAGLTRRAAFSAPTLHLQVMAPPAHLSLLAWFTLSRFGVSPPLQRALDVEEFRCAALDDAATYVQADAELLGPLPFTARVVPDGLTLLIPAAR
jgi:diacylglycerol kinase family enzyme